MSHAIPDWLQTATEQASKKCYWQVGDQTLSYGELLDKVGRTQSWLTSLGAQPQQRLLLLTENDVELLPLLLGAWSAGLSVAVVNAQATQSEVSDCTRQVAPHFIITSKPALFDHPAQPHAAQLLKIDLPPKRTGFLGKLLKSQPVAQEMSYPALLKQATPSVKPVSLPPESDALILFSSGTTGLPKGMVLSFAAITNNIRAISKRMGYGPESRIHNALPLHHVDGLLHGPVLSLLCGATLVRSLPFSFDSMERYIGEMFRYQITHLITVPTILAFIHKHREAFPGLFRWDAFKMLVSTAGPLNADQWRQQEEDFGVRICNVYGLSETTIAATICGPDDANYRHGTVGTALEGVDVAVVDEAGQAVAIGSPGEVYILSNALFSRYLDTPQSSAAVLAGGWLKTGDIGQLHHDGSLSIIGRIKNIIIKGGENINPEEVTACLLSCPGVLAAEVIGLPDPYFGEIITAAVVTGDQTPSDAHIMAHCAHRLSSSKLPDKILRFTALPYGPSGKVLREVLKQQCLEKLGQHPSAGALTQLDIEAQLRRIASHVFMVAEEQLSLGSTPGNTQGWDSLGHLNFAMAVEEQYGFQFSAIEMMRLESMAAFVDLTHHKLKGMHT